MATRVYGVDYSAIRQKTGLKNVLTSELSTSNTCFKDSVEDIKSELETNMALERM